jgi:hypothetical protein
MSHRQKIEAEWHTEFLKAKKELYKAIPDNRLNENYALLLAFHNLLCDMIGIEYDLKSYIKSIGQNKYDDCNKTNETIADYFFNLLLGNELNESGDDQCYKFNEHEQQIYIHLPKAIMAIEKKGLPFKGIQIKDLQKSLHDHSSFLASNQNRQLAGRSQKVWIFDYQKIVGDT